MVFRVWHLTGLALAAVLLLALVLPGQPAVALVALAGLGAAVLLVARARGVELGLQAELRRLLEAQARERAAVEREREVTLERVGALKRLAAAQQQTLAELAREVDRAAAEARTLAAAGAAGEPSVLPYARSA